MVQERVVAHKLKQYPKWDPLKVLQKKCNNIKVL